jgi:hypothetical protein
MYFVISIIITSFIVHNQRQRGRNRRGDIGRETYKILRETDRGEETERKDGGEETEWRARGKKQRGRDRGEKT